MGKKKSSSSSSRPFFSSEDHGYSGYISPQQGPSRGAKHNDRRRDPSDSDRRDRRSGGGRRRSREEEDNDHDHGDHHAEEEYGEDAPLIGQQNGQQNNGTHEYNEMGSFVGDIGDEEDGVGALGGFTNRLISPRDSPSLDNSTITSPSVFNGGNSYGSGSYYGGNRGKGGNGSSRNGKGGGGRKGGKNSRYGNGSKYGNGAYDRHDKYDKYDKYNEEEEEDEEEDEEDDTNGSDSLPRMGYIGTNQNKDDDRSRGKSGKSGSNGNREKSEKSDVDSLLSDIAGENRNNLNNHKFHGGRSVHSSAHSVLSMNSHESGSTKSTEDSLVKDIVQNKKKGSRFGSFGSRGFGRNKDREERNKSSTSGLTMRNGSKWFGKGKMGGLMTGMNGMGANSTNGMNGGGMGGMNGTGGLGNMGGMGVAYRSADSTQRALEELKRKRMEAQEKKRALSILCGLFFMVLTVHYIRGSSASSLDANGLEGSSKDKKYGDVKELGYGGERMKSSPLTSGAGGAGGTGGQGDNDNADSENDENDENAPSQYSQYDSDYLPPPTEKIYDEEHQFLLPLKHFADWKDLHRPSDTAYFFHVPRAGGSSVKDLIGKCLKLVQSSEVGVRDGHGGDEVSWK